MSLQLYWMPVMSVFTKSMYFPLPAKHKMNVIKQGGKFVCYNEITSSFRTRPYIIGFATVSLARHVQYTMAAEPDIRLQRRDFIDITHDVSRGLDEFGIEPPNTNSIIIDTRALLHISKCKKPVSSHPLHDAGFHISDIPVEDFMMYPFDKNVGVIMPYHIEDENDDIITFKANVIEATDSINTFRMSLDSKA